MRIPAALRMHLEYARYVLKHKVAVYRAGRWLGVPRRLCLLHDWSKLLPDEWVPYARYFYGPKLLANAGEVAARKRAKTAFDKAWLLHIHRNRHHPQFWVLRNDTDGLALLPMPTEYLLEMLADWMGAGMAQKGHGLESAPKEMLAWWKANKDKSGYAMEEGTRLRVERWVVALGATGFENSGVYQRG
jgi:hypothetical protein